MQGAMWKLAATPLVAVPVMGLASILPHTLLGMLACAGFGAHCRARAVQDKQEETEGGTREVSCAETFDPKTITHVFGDVEGFAKARMRDAQHMMVAAQELGSSKFVELFFATMRKG